jgi:ABC-type Zn uptake system ZnuABC Zn-binding protein ZnuA
VGESGDEQGRPDPHVWFDIANVKRWVENVVRVLSGLDPANAGVYADRAAAYLVELSDLEALTETRLDLVPPENRKLVTNHDALGYFAHAYGFEVVATVIPAASTLAEPSAGDLVDLIEAMEANGVCTIFSEASVSDELAQAAAAELRGCRQVMVAALYTEALGPPGSGADSYIGMFTSNVETIVEGLK